MVVVCLSGRRDVVETETGVVDSLDCCGCQWGKSICFRYWGSRLVGIMPVFEAGVEILNG